MNAVAMWLIGATGLLLAALVADTLLARRRPLAMSALWNATLVALLAVGPAAWLLPRWELPLLPAEAPPAASELAPIHIDGAGRLAIGPPPPSPRTAVLPSGNYVSAPPARTFTQIATLAEPMLWRNWDLDVVAVTVVLYLFGVTLLLLRLLANLIAVHRLRRSAQTVTGGTWLARFEHWRRAVAPWRAVALLVSDAVSVPIVLGWRRPAVVIPAGLAEETDSASIDAVLVHELAHVERGDYGWQLVERLVQAVYWFHPLVWLASRRIAALRERACDDFAIHALADRNAYAETLIEMAARLAKQKQLGGRQRLGLAMAVVRTSKLEQRLAAIETSSGQSRVRLYAFVRSAVAVALLAVITLAIGVRLVRAEPKSAPPQKAAGPPASKLTPPIPTPTTGGALGEASDNVDDLFKDADSKDTANSEPDEEFQFHDNLEGKFSQAERDAAKKLFEFLLKHEYDQAAGLFTSELRDSLSGERLQNICESLAKQFGKLQPRASLHHGRIGNHELLELITNWGREHVISARLLFDEQERIAGIWLGRSPLVAEMDPAPIKWGEGAGGGVLTAESAAFGEPMLQLLKNNLSITVNLLDEQGTPVPLKDPKDPFRLRVTFFRALGKDESASPKDYWSDTTSGVTWRYLGSESRESNRAERLAPGTYRVFVNSHPEGGFELSDPIVLDGTVRETVLNLPRRPRAAVVVNLVDERTGEPVTGADVRITSDDPQIPSYRYGSSEYPESKIEFSGLLAGWHKITAQRAAGAPEQNEYISAEVPVLLKRGETAELTLKLRGKPLAPREVSQRWPFVLQGKVVDANGKPVAGATLTTYSGIATLFPSGHATTDDEGRYLLRFAAGGHYVDGHSFGGAIVKVTKPGLFDRDATTRKPFRLKGNGPEPPLDDPGPGVNSGAEWIALQADVPHVLDFVLHPAVEFSLELVDEASRPLPEVKFDLQSVEANDRISIGGTTGDEGRVDMSGIDPQQAVRWTIPTDRPYPARSNPVRFASPGEYRVRLQSLQDQATARRFLKVAEVLNPAGKDVTAEVVQDDPLLRDPLPAELQTSCREIVAKMLAANRLWIEPVPKGALPNKFELRFDRTVRGQKKRVTYENTGPGSLNPHATHGMTYVSQLAGLADAENVVFRALEVTPQRVTLAYTFKRPVRVQAGNGVDNFWRGSTSAVSREGIVVIDPARNVPLEVQGDALHERFHAFQFAAARTYVPLQILIDVVGYSQLAFDWRFHLYEPEVWMLDTARQPQSADSEPIMVLDQLLIDGRPAQRVDGRLPDPPQQGR